MKKLTKTQKAKVLETFRKLKKAMSLENALLEIASIILNYQLKKDDYKKT